MHDFEYAAPVSLDEAVRILAENNGSARPLAGGTDLIDHVRTGRLTPDVLFDVKKIAELNVLEHSADGLRLGAAVPCYRIYGDPRIAADYSALADATRIIGGIQIQSRASVGGNLCNSGPAADSTPALIALEAVAVLFGPDGRREVPVDGLLHRTRPERAPAGRVAGRVAVSAPLLPRAVRTIGGSSLATKWTLPSWGSVRRSCSTRKANRSTRPESRWERSVPRRCSQRRPAICWRVNRSTTPSLPAQRRRRGVSPRRSMTCGARKNSGCT